MTATIRVQDGSTEYLRVPVGPASVVLAAQPVAISLDSGTTWLPAQWEGDPGTTRTARTTNPVLFEVAAGEVATAYPVLVRITDTPEVPILGAGWVLVSTLIPGPGIVTLEEAKQGLNIRTDSDDAELESFLLAATEQVEAIVGPVREKVVTERHAAAGDTLVLRTTPVLSVGSIVGRLGAVSLYGSGDLDVDPATGIVRVSYGGRFSFPTYGGVDVTYIAGRTEVPEAIKKATIIILDHLWKTQRGWVARPTLRGEDLTYPGAEGGLPLGFALPSRAVQLLQPYTQMVVA